MKIQTTYADPDGWGLLIDGRPHPNPVVMWCGSERVAAGLATNLYPRAEIITSRDPEHPLHKLRPPDDVGTTTTAAMQAYWEKIRAMPITENTDPYWPFKETVLEVTHVGAVTVLERVSNAEELMVAFDDGDHPSGYDRAAHERELAVWPGSKEIRGDGSGEALPEVDPSSYPADAKPIEFPLPPGFYENALSAEQTQGDVIEVPPVDLEKMSQGEKPLEENFPPPTPARPLTLKEKLALKGIK